MPASYVLIDYENVQPRNLDVLAKHPFKVIVFVGANQAKVPIDVAVAMQSLGDRAQYLKISGNGQNALDFHIAFYVGELSAGDPKAEFHIISKDTGFDPLIKHLRDRKIRVQRDEDLAEIPVLRISTATSSDDKIAAIVKNLAGRGQSRPRKVRTLTNTINNLFTKKLGEAELTTIVDKLQKRGFIVVDKGKVSYQLPQVTP